jgi:hypothetical protein
MTTKSPWVSRQTIAGVQAPSAEPALAFAGKDLHAVWTTEQVLYHACLQDGVWSAPVRVAAGDQPTLVGDPGGLLHCLFVNRFVGNYEIYYVKYDGEAWSLPQNISRTRGISGQPRLAVTANGELHAVWAETAADKALAIYHGFPEGDFWRSVPTPQIEGSAPAITVDTDNDLRLVWQHRTNADGRFEVLFRTWHDGAWSLPEVVSDPEQGHALQPLVVTDAKGGCHVIWHAEKGGIYNVCAATRLGPSWSTPTVLSGGHGDCRLVCAATYGQKLVQAVWMEGRELHHRGRPAGAEGGWWAEEIADADCGEVVDLALAVNASGQTHIVWASLDDKGAPRLYHTERGPLLKPTVFMPNVTG